MVHQKKIEAQAVFGDLKNAYDKVDREKLYKLLKKNSVLNEQELLLIKFIHNNIRVFGETLSVRCMKGLPQGLVSSPLLFNIYTDELAKALKDK